KTAREEHASMYATRWSELARLPYFDFCRMIVVDPMHNLFLGLVKTHFYHIWVQLKIFRKSKELNRVHQILSELRLPSRLGRLPRLIGEPAGGSLTADQWLILAMVVGPLAVSSLMFNRIHLPELWEEIATGESDDNRFFQKRLDALRQRVVQRRKASQKAKRGSMIEPKGYYTSMTSASEPRRSTRARKPTEKAKQADKLLREYCVELVELYGAGVIRPNHHYATHTAEFIRDYGPLRGYWTFIFERLNKILKSFRTNNHEGGEIEMTFFREFYR
ncbi:hypothetical protein BD414DRAFT_394137, partial [Trametes punicea]